MFFLLYARLNFCALKIFLCYSYVDSFQENIIGVTYGENDKFTFICSLLLIQCVVSVILSKILLHTFIESRENSTKQLYYAAIGFSYPAAMICNILALRHIDSFMQVFGEVCKPIPIIILSILIARKTYPWEKYVWVFMIITGVYLFNYPAVVSSSNLITFGSGELLLLVSLFLDGFTGAVQYKMRYKARPAHMMYYINLWSCLMLYIVVLATGEICCFMKFVKRYPYVMHNILKYSVTSALGQILIYKVVSEFGPLCCSTIMVTRKFFTQIFTSIYLNQDPFTHVQLVGMNLVLLGLTFDGQTWTWML